MVNQIIYGFRSAMLPDTYAPLGGGNLEAEAFVLTIRIHLRLSFDFWPDCR